MELQSRLKELQQKGLGLVSISYDAPEPIAAFAKSRGITYPMLSDAGSVTIKRFGILNPVPEWALGPDKDDPVVKEAIQKYVSVVRPNPNMVGMAFPGTFIVDRQGRVTSRHFEESYIERNTISSVLIKTRSAAPVTGTKVSTGQLDLTTYPSDAVIAAGNRFSLAVDIQPHRGMHIYAPGASGYRVISLKLDPQPYLKVLPMTYPSSEIYFFKPLSERVPVFQKPFSLIQELILDGQPQSQALYRGKESITINGTLEYQACDDLICYNPMSIPLSWTLSLRSLVTERPIPAK